MYHEFAKFKQNISLGLEKDISLFNNGVYYK